MSRSGQHFFALKLSKGDLIQILKALQNASVVTDPANRQIVSNGGPPDVQDLVGQLGKRSGATTRTHVKLSSGVEIISKPSGEHVPPWQMVSATLNIVHPHAGRNESRLTQVADSLKSGCGS
jgi:hypothetical protein